jgi:hypothetical protein
MRPAPVPLPEPHDHQRTRTDFLLPSSSSPVRRSSLSRMSYVSIGIVFAPLAKVAGNVKVMATCEVPNPATLKRPLVASLNATTLFTP